MVQPFLVEWLSAFGDPQKRIFWGYLASAATIGLLWLWLYKSNSLLTSVKTVFSARAWLSRSARADYLVMMINAICMALVSPRLLAKATVAYTLFNGLHGVFDGRPLLAFDPPAWVISVSFTLFLFIVDDFARYWLHRWLHTLPWLWAFHKVHHSATALNPFTVFRTHPVEAVLFSLRGALVQGFCVAVVFFFFGNRFELVTVLGASVFTFVFNALGSNLRHSPVAIGYWLPLERIFISPAQHHIHHSLDKQHIDKNFGVALALWDLMFGSLCYSSKDQALQYGVRGDTSSSPHRLSQLYLQPFADSFAFLRRKLTQMGAITGMKLSIPSPPPSSSGTMRSLPARCCHPRRTRRCQAGLPHPGQHGAQLKVWSWPSRAHTL